MRYLLLSLITLSSFAACKAQNPIAFKNTEIIYGRKDGMALTMFKLAPKERSNGKAIISVVSGNWVSSYNYATYLTNRAKIYVDKGYTVFVTMHGSQPRYAINDEIADLKRAVRFIRYHAKEYNIDPSHIGITGSSSGGHLSLMVGLLDDKVDTASKDPIDKVSSRVQAVAVFYPPTDFLNWGQEKANLTEARGLLALAGVASAFEFKEWSDSTRTYKVIAEPTKLAEIVKQNSPIYAVTSDDPPVLIIHGDADRTVPLQQSETIIEKLKETNISNQLVIKKGGAHGWDNIGIDEQQFISWFDKYLK
ncbi:alpha/beta hydrolase [Segetibacter sp.]|jgi:acetyl esterase/lipase|uniref:alpha/beta hydrolase n=1 Tax=Segetibacter sp. TaxID=2231182 RepID=UPI002619113C|nr:alpha/beta hydrolase [Segetibacter sp.]MCW3079575.1 alpha/beta hydrolase [Segetibacter sp.]